MHGGLEQMRPYRTCALALLALLAAACGEADRQWAGSVTDSAGIAIVSNTADGIWSSSDVWTLEEELRIGTLEGDPEYQFGQISWLAVDAEGAIYVLDSQAQHIQVYSPEGEYRQTIGQRGGGPGELQQAGFLFMGPGDTLLVPDIGNRRVNRYAPDGSSAGSFNLALEQGLPLLFKATSTGIIAEQVRPFSLPGQPALENPQDAIVLLEPDGTIIDTVKTFPSGGTFSLGGPTPEINIYSAEPIWEITDELQLLYGVNDTYRIGVYSSDGSLERVVTMPSEPKPVTDTDRDAVMGYLEQTWLDAGVPAQTLPQLKSIVHFAETFPAFSFISSGPVGTIWVQHVQPASELTEEELESYDLLQDAGARDWDVFDAEGKFLGVVSMPPRFAPRVFINDRIYGVWRDELDVQHMVRLRIVGDLSTGTT